MRDFSGGAPRADPAVRACAIVSMPCPFITVLSRRALRSDEHGEDTRK
jgi:hypothetical protein